MSRTGIVVVPCPRCGQDLPAESLRAGGARCYNCESTVEAVVFGAAFSKPLVPEDTPLETGEASCFFHPERQAVVPCSHCGRFLCNLCRVDWSGSSLCISCLDAFQKAPRSSFLSASRFHFDSLALALATVPSLIISPSIVTAPMALGLTLFTFRRQTSITPRSKWRFIVAGVLALAQIVGWVWLVVYTVSQAAQANRR